MKPKNNKVLENNLISQIASITKLDKAFNELMAKHITRQSSANHLIWSYAKTWRVRKAHLRDELQRGTFNLGPLTNYQIQTLPGRDSMQVSVWEPESEIVLKVLKEVLEPYLKSKMNLTYASHLKGNGGLKASVTKAQKLCNNNKYVLKTDVAKFYASIRHAQLRDLLSKYLKDQKVLDLIMQYCNRCEITNANHVLISDKSIPRGCPLSPLIGAVYLQPLDEFARAHKLEYVRYMDDYIFFTKTRWKLRAIITKTYKILDDLGLRLAKDKTYMGKLDKGFDFLGYRIVKEKLSIAKTSFARLGANISRLYEQQASNERLGKYLKNWLRWAKGGVDNLIAPIIVNGNRNRNINLTETCDPSARIKVFVRDDKCFVWV